MPWFDPQQLLPPEGELIAFWDADQNTVCFGRYRHQQWLEEDSGRHVERVSRWAPILDVEDAEMLKAEG